MKKIITAVLLLVLLAVPAYAFTSYWYEMMYVQKLITGSGGESVAGYKMLMSDGASYIVLDDGTSKITLS